MSDPIVNDQLDLQNFEQELGQVNPRFDPVTLSNRALEKVAFHDFAFYEYLFPTEQGIQPGLSEQALAIVDQVEQQSGLDAASLIADALMQLENGIREGVAHRTSSQWNDSAIVDEIIRSFYENGAINIPDLLTTALTERTSGAFNLFLNFIYGTARAYICTRLSQHYHLTSLWAGWPDEFETQYYYYRIWTHGSGPQIQGSPVNTTTAAQANAQEIFQRCMNLGNAQDYPFEVFPNRSLNIGLRLIYRQDWNLLGAQPGDIVRTIPLGPGQREKVTTKVIRRSKFASTSETVQETETTTESSSNTKDSTEIVQEAAETYKFNQDLEVGGSFLGIGAKSNTNFTYNDEEKSRRASSRLSEIMRKSASRVRRQTKVVVSTESEATFEQENYSEITNPNNEAAITYEYYKQQQQYEVFTYLAEVQSVIFVAEDLPQTVDADWVLRHDWIIARRLKDESHRTALNELLQDQDEGDPANGLNPNPFASMAASARQSFASFNQSGGQGSPQGQGLSIPDIYAEPQRIYQDYLREQNTRNRSNLIRQKRRARLLQHLRDNILYYCRYIWASEDSDQRLLRYKKEGRRIPIRWTGPLVTLQNAPTPNYTPTGDTAPLWELIDPTGPLGYVGNYAVFGLRPFQTPTPENRHTALLDLVQAGQIDLSLEEVLAGQRAPYVDSTTGTLLDPALRAFRRDAMQINTGSPQALTNPTPTVLEDIASYIPRLRPLLPGNNQPLQNPITVEEYAQYLYRKNGTRRFLVDTNNLYLNINVGGGAALEPFKRAHRYIDVLKASEELDAIRWKNQRRQTHLNNAATFDPDVEKVIVIDDGDGLIAGQAVVNEALRREPSAVSPVIASPADGNQPSDGTNSLPS